MKKIFIAIALSLALMLSFSACKTKHVIEWRDSVRTEIKTEIVKVPDTVLVEIPADFQSIQTYDSTSFLENKWCKTTATITSGMLTHTLETKEQAMPVPTEKEIVYKDSIVYRDRVVTKTKTEYVEKELSWYQESVLYLFWPVVCLLLFSYRKTIWKIVKVIV